MELSVAQDIDPSAHFSVGSVDLWYCQPAIFASDSSLLSRYESLIDQLEYDHYKRLRFPDHKLEYLASHALLRYVLSVYFPSMQPSEWAFSRNAHGKPSLIPEQQRDFPVAFNLSHTHGMALCAIAQGGELGVDVECHANSQSLLEVADHYFSDREVEDLFKLPSDAQQSYFFHYWTLKEAYIKARGEGLSIPLDSFSFLLREDSVEFVLPDDSSADSSEWCFRLLHPGAKHTAAVAWNQTLDTLRLFEASPLLNFEARNPSEPWRLLDPGV